MSSADLTTFRLSLRYSNKIMRHVTGSNIAPKPTLLGNEQRR